MNITDIKIRRMFQDAKLKALISITIDNSFAVHDIKVIQGSERLFVAMPSRRDESGAFRDIAHPITAESRTVLEDAILNEYLSAMDEMEFSDNNDNADFSGEGYDMLKTAQPLDKENL